MIAPSTKIIEQTVAALTRADRDALSMIPARQRLDVQTVYAFAATALTRYDLADPTWSTWEQLCVLDAVLALPNHTVFVEVILHFLRSTSEADGLLSAPAAQSLNDYILPIDTWAFQPLYAIIQAAVTAESQTVPPAAEASIFAFGALRDPRPVPALVRLLRHPDRSLVRAAAIVLGELGDSRAIEPLMTTLRERRLPDAALALGRLRATDAIDVLLTLWDEQVHAEIARWDQQVVEDDLEDAIPNETLLRALAEALGRLGHPAAIPRLSTFIPSMYGYDTWVQLEVTIALSRLGDDRCSRVITDALAGDTPERRQHAARALLERGDARALDALVTSYLADEDEVMGRQALIAQLGRFGTAWDLPLLRWIQQHDHTPSENAGWPLSAAATRAILRIEARQQRQTNGPEG